MNDQIEQLRLKAQWTCTKHEISGEVHFNRAGKNKKGQQLYKCKLCIKPLRDNNYKKNREKILATQRAYMVANPEKRRKQKAAFQRKYALQHREKLREYGNAWKKQEVIELGDSYVKKQIRRNTTLEYKDIPQVMVETKRATIKINRLIKRRSRNSNVTTNES